jgi:hypothetical protein
MSLFGLDLARSGDHFTFSDLVDAPEYSLAGGLYLRAPAIKTYQGKPWEIMRENRLVYNFSLGLVVPIFAIIQPVKLTQAGNFLISTGMLMPGSITEDGSRVTDYSAHFGAETGQFRYSEVEYV